MTKKTQRSSNSTYPSRRDILKGVAGVAVVSALGLPRIGRAQAQTVKIGVIYPLTGMFAYNGSQCMKGAEIALEEINANGGIGSLGGARLELLIGDSESKPEVAVSEVDRLADEGISAFLGGYSSGITLTASQAAARRNIPYLGDTAVSDQITDRGLPGVFRFGPGFKKITEVSLDNLVAINEAAGKPAKTVALVHEDGAFGGGLSSLLASELPNRGFEVIENIGHPTPTRDFTNIGLRLRAAKPDLIIPSSYLNEYVLLARTIHQQQVEYKAIYSIIGGGASNMGFVREFNDAAQYIMDCSHWVDPTKDRTQAFMRKLEERNIDLTYEVMLNYAGLLLIADAIERASSTEPGDVSEAIAASTFEDHIQPYGPTRFVNGQNTGAQPVNTQIQGHTIEVVYPDEYASADIVFPRPEQS